MMFTFHYLFHIITYQVKSNKINLIAFDSNKQLFQCDMFQQTYQQLSYLQFYIDPLMLFNLLLESLDHKIHR
jgi:hypothetical protein